MIKIIQLEYKKAELYDNNVSFAKVAENLTQNELEAKKVFLIYFLAREPKAL